MNSNKLIYGGAFFSVIFFIVLYNSSNVDRGAAKVQQHSTMNKPVTIDSIEGDTTADSYQSLERTVQKSVNSNDSLRRQNKQLQEQINRLEADFNRMSNIQRQISSDYVSNKRKLGEDELKELKKPKLQGDVKEDEESDKQKIIDKVNSYTPKRINPTTINGNNSDFHMKGNYNFSNGLGLSKFKSSSSQRTKKYDKNDPNAGWVMPVGSKAEEKTNIQSKNINNKSIKRNKHSAMTISDNSILYDAKALTYLVGRIPVGGRVADPYPVKIIVGREVLIANGHSLPGIEGMFFTGYATGDMNLNCVRAEMNSYTFVFDDGRQVTFREKSQRGKGQKEPLAYISDRFGLPCIVGKFVSNVAEFLSIQTSLSALSAAGEAYAAAQTTTGINNSGNGSSAVTGDKGKYALGKVASGSVSDIRKWFLERQENSFDAIVVPSGSKMSLHLNRDIIIDYDEAARKVDYQFDLKTTAELD